MDQSSSSSKKSFSSFLEQHDEKAWLQILHSLTPSIHLVDRLATRVWFSFWPLELSRLLQNTNNSEQLVRDLELAGQYRLQDSLDSSVCFLFGSRYWVSVKKAVLAHSECSQRFDDLEQQILKVTETVSRDCSTDPSTLLGITCIAFMALQQVGLSNFKASNNSPTTPFSSRWPAQKILRSREKRSRFFFLKSINQKHTIVFDESNPKCQFKAIDGQDISMAAGADRRDYPSIDKRCLEEPIPFQCRSGSCGTCWIGVLHGKERLSKISKFESERLQYFGYSLGNSNKESHPSVRLACQTKCHGNISIVVPPWNGVLNMRRYER